MLTLHRVIHSSNTSLALKNSKSLKAASHSHYQRQQMHQLVIVCTIAGFSAIQFPGGIGGIGVNMASPTTLT